uniref:Uncharacterized protein n=1 Tax=Anguilla anguilla TaxID=7936 RepID=A0A0E9QS07_ANGAN
MSAKNRKLDNLLGDPIDIYPVGDLWALWFSLQSCYSIIAQVAEMYLSLHFLICGA